MKNIPKAWELVKEEELSDISSKGFLLRHRKSGARAAVIENDDPNKVFYIGFRTPAVDSTGAAHIIEHTVLCGSEKYPAKDPFVELAKGSMNTFLNAMTYPDKTVYPVASTNLQDFKNLTDVYMDAVLHPNIYRVGDIFRQEGWHYELKGDDSDLTINGVVYNEMKGAFSSPDDVLEREIMSSLFPDTTYHFESGGDPEVIPSLTYEDFLDFHRRYYHPVNSYIYIYGDCDMEERLDYLDREYLSAYDTIELDSTIKKQDAFSEPVRVWKEYSVSKDEDTDEKTYLSLNKVVGDTEDAELYLAFDILDKVLLNTPGAPLRKALSEADIATDVMGGYDSSTIQPVFSIQLKGSEEKHLDRFLNIVKDVLQKQVEKGIDKKALLGAINISEFRFREADFGSVPKGLVWGLGILDSWLYDDGRPFDLLHSLRIYDSLRKKADSRYFEDLIRKYLILNNHASVVIIRPKPGLTSQKDETLRQRLSKLKNEMSADEREKLIDETARLRKYQEEPDTPEVLEKIPMLSRKDLRRNITPYKNELRRAGDIDYLFHDINTNGIAYISMMFDVTDADPDMLCTMSLLSRIMSLMDTEGYTYPEFSKEVLLHTGGLMVMMKTAFVAPSDYRLFFKIHSKFLYREFDKAFSLIEEMILKTEFSDTDRLYELIKQEYSAFQEKSLTAGHTVAASRLRSYYSERGCVAERVSGVTYYRFIKDLYENYEERRKTLPDALRECGKYIFGKDNVFFSVTGEEELKGLLDDYLPGLSERLLSDRKKGERLSIVPTKENEGLETASRVQYVARGGNFLRHGNSYTGAMEVLKTILSYEYFWQNIRVQGGAYGCMSDFTRSGDISFLSYRDPHLERTNNIFEKTADFLENFEVSERDMTKYVIGTIGIIDTPRTPSQEGERCLSHYLSGLSDEEIQKKRDEILDADVDDIRALAKPVRDVLSQGYICAVGNEEKLRAEKDLFMKTEKLL